LLFAEKRGYDKAMEEYKNTDLRRELKCHAEACLEMGKCDNPGELCKDCRFYY